MTKGISILVLMFITSTSVAQSMCLDLFEKKALVWPAENEALDFELLTDFMRSELMALSLKRDSSVKAGKVAWAGQPRIRNIYVGQSDIPERFTKTMLDYHQERDRDVLDVAIMTFVHLGMDMAVGKLKNSPQMEELVQKTKALSDKVDQKIINKQQFNLELRSILESVNWIVKNHDIIFFENAFMDFQAVASVQKMILGYYKLPNESAQADLLVKLSSLNVISQEQGFRAWMKNNTTTFGNLAQRIQDHLDQQSSDKTELDFMDEMTIERIKSGLEISMM